MDGEAMARVDRKSVTEAPVICLDGRFRYLYADIHGIVRNQLFSAVSAWNGGLNVLLPAVYRVVKEGHKGVLKTVLVVLE